RRVDEVAARRTIDPRREHRDRGADAELSDIERVAEVPGRRRVTVWNNHLGQRRAVHDAANTGAVVEADAVEHESLARTYRGVKAPSPPRDRVPVHVDVRRACGGFVASRREPGVAGRRRRTGKGLPRVAFARRAWCLDTPGVLDVEHTARGNVDQNDESLD